MSRTADAGNIAASQADVVRPVLLVDLDYPAGPVRACSMPHDVTIGADTYFGLGALGAVSEIVEGVEQRSYGVQLSLSGVPGNFADYLSSQDVQGRRATIRLAFVDAGYAVIGEPTVVFVGRMDTQDIAAGQTTAVQVAIESLLIDWERPRIRRYTDVDQQTRYAGDRGLEYVAAVAGMEIRWQ